MTKTFEIAEKWREYLEDVAYQVAVLKDLHPGVPVRPHLILMDKGKVAAHDGMPGWFKLVKQSDDRVATAEFIGDPALARRDPLTITIDVSAEVEELEPEVREAAARFVASLTPAPQRLVAPLGGHCKSCEYRTDAPEPQNGFLTCWGERGKVRPHVLDLYQGRDLREELLAAGVDHLVDVTEDHFAGRTGTYAARQRIQVEQTRRNEEWSDPALQRAMAGVVWPLHFIDFEAATMAIPHHKAMKPYGQLAFQWSCHTQREPGAPLEHREYLNVDASWPNERFARSLREAIGDHGTLLVWSAFEKSVLNRIADDLTALGSGDGELAGWLRATGRKAGTEGSRQIDMLALCRQWYYHPGMGGSNSIKVVLDAVWKAHPEVRARFAHHSGRTGDPALGPYAALDPAIIAGAEEEVAEGTGAMRAYFKLAYGFEKDDPDAVAKWSRLLKEYCKLDTLAMVLIWEHWSRLGATAR